VSETNDVLWKALIELFVAPERIQSLIAPAPENDLELLKKQLGAVEKEQRIAAAKTDRLLNLYLEGNLPQAAYVVKSSELERETEKLAQTKNDLQRRIQNHGKQGARTELIQTIRILSRSHRRFTEEQKTRVFRSLIRETRITTSGVDFEMYVAPTQNVWWKYRQKRQRSKAVHEELQTLRIGVPQPHALSTRVYTAGDVAKMIGVSVHLVRLRIKSGKYPTPLRSGGNRRLFTDEHIRQIQAIQ
jgi:hypothetical protein